MKAKVAGWLIPAGLIAIVAVIYRHVGLRWSDIDKRLNPLAALALALTIYVAFYVQYHLGARTAVDRAEKDIVITLANDVGTLIRQAYDKAYERWAEDTGHRTAATVVLTTLRRASNRIEDLREAVDESRLLRPSAQQVKNIRDEFTSFKTALTGRNFPANQYNAQDLMAHERAYRNLSRSITTFVLQVNRKV